ncbi:MAG: flavin-dependent oxidoreductase [Ilumatobacteraceae bacterium]
MKVIIVGGGIGGCALALSLHAAGIVDVEVHEAADGARELGVGINVLPHAMRELDEMGLAERLAAIAVAPTELSYHNRFGQQIWLEPRGLAAGYLWPQLSVHRGALLSVLHDETVRRLGEHRFHHASRMAAADLEHLDGDVIVACDGVHSVLRPLVAPAEGPPLWNGVTMWRGTTVAEPFLGGRRMIMAGVLAHRMVIYPIRDLPDGRQLINWVAEVRTEDGRPMPRQDWDATVDVSEPLGHFDTFRFDWLDVPSLIEQSEQILCYPMVDRDPLTTWRLGRMTLLGDAAHPMYPVGSNGASQAIVDARVLARELRLRPGVSDALRAYEEQRLPATAAVVLANRRAGPERSMELVAERAPNGFERLDDVISHDELVAIAADYKRTAGFDPATLNDRPSLSVPGS